LNQISTFYRKIFFLFFLIKLTAYSQVNYSFIQHLSVQNLQREHKTYISTLAEKTATDSINYLTAKYYLQYFNDSLFLDSYIKSKTVFKNDTNATNIASVVFLTSNKRDIWFANYPTQDNTSYMANSVYSVYLASKNPNNTDITLMPEELQADFLDYKNYYHKKPWVAAGLSTLVPGLGELYAGKKRSFVNTLLFHVMYGLQAYEAGYKLGIKKPFTVFSIGFFGVFYFANIYGSYFDVKQAKKEKRKQFLIDATNYYNLNYATKLYP